MKLKLTLILAAAAVIGGPVSAADIEAGKKKAAVCAACHGQDGISMIPNYPNLKGQKAAYTEKQLFAFKDKKRNDPIMAAQAAALSDDDIKNLAAYYESLGKK
ncbi:c-type cytochrome [Aliikangiella maris]|uniref:Cytochrome c n=2 Tax=Aliikangiella maris TaxID=3162458 RepID=A0ABV2BUV5_9GAMM